jgi:phage terminase large subunit
MQYETTTALKKILAMRSRLRIVQGGARAGKTIAILMCLIDMATNQENGKLVISVVSETLPHLKRGAIRDFLSIMEGRGYLIDKRWNRSDFIYTFETGSIIEFFSADSPDKVRGPGRDVLFINECNNVPFETYRQLALRTRKVIYLDYNPDSEFYVHTDLIPKRPHDFVKLTYLDNEALDKEIVSEVEAMKDSENLWRVYGLGEVGSNFGQIYTNWEIIPELPEEGRLERHAVDFGYSNDPAAVVDLCRWNGGFVIDELAYVLGLDNRALANSIREAEGLPAVPEEGHYEGRTKTLTVADSAEPKSIDEIKGLVPELPLEGRQADREGAQRR